MTEAQYIKFLRDVYRKSNGEPLKPPSIRKYSSQTISKIDKYIPIVVPDAEFTTLYDVPSIEELNMLKQKLESYPPFIRDDKVGRGMYSNGLDRYIQFAEGVLIYGFTDHPEVLDVKEPITAHVNVTQRDMFRRDPLKITQAKGACDYTCQLDKDHSSFISESSRKRYVEGHHIIPLCCQKEFDYNLDVLANIIVLCPTCHRFLHYGIKSEVDDRLKAIYDDRYGRFENTGILVDRPLFLEMAEHGIRKENDGHSVV